MDAVEVEVIRGEVDALVGALNEERFRHVAGIEPTPALAPIFRAHGRAAHRDTVKALAAAGEAELSTRVASLRAERAQAEREEAWRAEEAAATGQGPDGRIPLGEAQLAQTRERDRERRLALGAAVAEAAAQPSREAAIEERARARGEGGLVPDWEQVVAADALLSATDDAYRDVLAWEARREAGLAPAPAGELARADVLFVLAAHRYEGLFPRGMLAVVLARAAEPLRLRLAHIRIDDGSRPSQWLGAHALGARVSLRRQGGASDYLQLLEAAGQALASAAAPAHRLHPAAPFTMGALLAGLLLDRGFLAARLDVDRRAAPDLVRTLALRQLFRLRTAAAALRVATEVERGLAGAAWHEAHREALSRAALASWPGGLAARDADAGRCGARLAGAARAEVLRRVLLERCDEDWWKNPRAADVLGGWLAAGGAWAGEEPKLALGGEALVSKL
jgi:hypothetical protein